MNTLQPAQPKSSILVNLFSISITALLILVVPFSTASIPLMIATILPMVPSCRLFKTHHLTPQPLFHSMLIILSLIVFLLTPTFHLYLIITFACIYSLSTFFVKTPIFIKSALILYIVSATFLINYILPTSSAHIKCIGLIKTPPFAFVNFNRPDLAQLQVTSYRKYHNHAWNNCHKIRIHSLLNLNQL